MNVFPKNRTESISIRVTPEEKKKVSALASAAGLTLTAFLLGKALGESLVDSFLDSSGSNMDKADK